MYFLHLSTHCVPKPNCASNQLVFCLRLHFSPVKFFQFMPHVLDWIQVGGLSWSSPPIDIMAPEKVGSIDGCMFGVIVLHKPVTPRKLFFQKRCLFNDFTEQKSLHDAIKNADATSSPYTNACPYMYFHRMFWPTCEIKSKLIINV